MAPSHHRAIAESDSKGFFCRFQLNNIPKIPKSARQLVALRPNANDPAVSCQRHEARASSLDFNDVGCTAGDVSPCHDRAVA